MFGSAILEIAIGLVLVYLLMSLVLTAVQEAIENILKTRATNLERAITELLQGNEELLKAFYEHPLIYALYKGDYAAGEDKARRRKLPSYIPRETFAAVLIDLDRTGGHEQLGQLMGHFTHFAPPGSVRLRREIESWFDGAMDRASGWYKRKTQLRLFAIGLVLSVVLNVNSVTIANYLAVSPQQRALVTALAEQSAQKGESETPQRLIDEMDKLGVPIGWETEELNRLRARFPPPAANWTELDLLDTLRGAAILATFLIGYLITAFAVMLGAPFWFDVLNRIMVIRATVKPKEKSPDEPSEEGGKDHLKPPAGVARGDDMPAPAPPPANP